MAEFGDFDDAFNPAQAKAQQEREEQQHHVAPAGDPKRDTAVDLDSREISIPATFDQPVPPPPVRALRPDEVEDDEDPLPGR